MNKLEAITRRSIEKVLAAGGAARAASANFRVGDTIKVYAKIIEGNKERIQVFEGIVLKRSRGLRANATFTVRKISFNIGVERTFMLYSPRIEKIEIVSRGVVRRARLFYLRPLRGKAARIKQRYDRDLTGGARSEAQALVDTASQSIQESVLPSEEISSTDASTETPASEVSTSHAP